MKKSFFKTVTAAFLCAALAFSAGCSSSSGSGSGADDDALIDDSSSGTPSSSQTSGASSSDGITGTTGGSIKSNAGVSIIKAQGWLETGYVTWSDSAESYNVYYKASSDTEYTQVDSPLIRNYGDYVRVDIIGLSAGDYDVKIHAVNDGTESDQYSEASISVASHDRAGYAFTGSTMPGAYNSDGTLKSGTKVLYVTNDNFNTIALTINTKADGSKTTTLTGIQEILDTSGYFKYLSANDNAPLCIRIIGKIDTTGFPSSAWGSSEEGLQVKGSSSYATTPLTIEGVGDDAVIHGFGILCRNTGYVELRNFAVMACSDDSISLDTANEYTWVHNLDLFYGSAGSDSDQAKGDGTIDLKGDTRYQTYSYNHFWDSGKSSLCGMKSESGPNYITYHHNWFDHSDSRHPRIRTMTVHIYNNYYDGNSKYGVGATTGADAFVEANYFRNCKFPMLSSLQGNDVYAGSSTYNPSDYGTFSDELGGSIKSYNNKIVDTLNVTSYWPHANSLQDPLITKGSVGTLPSGVDASVHFDAWEASSRDEQVPSTVTAYSGSDTYSNFDTASGFYSYSVQTPDDAKEYVETYAGRVEGGDFTWDLSAESEDTNYGVITALKTATVNYTSSMVKCYGTSWIYTNGTASGDSSSEETTVTFTAQSAIVSNDVSTLGITAVSAASSSESVATVNVDNGIVITSVSAGSATITCTDADGNTATIAVTVAANGAIATSVTKALVISALTAVEEGSYNMTTSGSLLSKQSSGAVQTSTDSRFIATCSIDSSGLNLKSDSAVYFRVEAPMYLTFTVTNEKGVAVYAVTSNGAKSSETALTNNGTAPSYSYELSAGMYEITGTTTSSAKIASLAFESAVFTPTSETVENSETKLGLEATSATSSDPDVVTVEVNNGIVITSVGKGSATITCTATDSDSNEITATIAVTVSGSGAITVGTITKYTADTGDSGSSGSAQEFLASDGSAVSKNAEIFETELFSLVDTVSSVSKATGTWTADDGSEYTAVFVGKGLTFVPAKSGSVTIYLDVGDSKGAFKSGATITLGTDTVVDRTSAAGSKLTKYTFEVTANETYTFVLSDTGKRIITAGLYFTVSE